MAQGLSEWFELGLRRDVAGERLFYRDSRPDAPPDMPCVVLLHGFPTASWDWRHVWQPLAAYFRLIAPDMPGFGFSAKPARAYPIAGQADVVAELLTALNVQRTWVLAHDYGDTVAQEWLARARCGDGAVPELQGVCLLNGGVFPEVQRPLRIQQVLAGPAGGWLVHLVDKRRALLSLRSVFGDDTPPSEGDLEAYWTLLTREHGLRVLPPLLGYLGERHRQRERWVGALADNAVPRRFLVGMRDPASGPAMVDRYRELVAAPDVVTIDSVGHFPHCESPDAVVDAFLAFAGDGT